MFDYLQHTLDDLSRKNKLTPKMFKKFLEICRSKYTKARIEPGTAVGAVGAQSIGNGFIL